MPDEALGDETRFLVIEVLSELVVDEDGQVVGELWERMVWLPILTLMRLCAASVPECRALDDRT